MIAWYVGKSARLDDAIVLYAKAHAYQVERDFTAFKKAVRAGDLQADTDGAGSLAFML